ncbi:MAG: hypothetical protein SFT90_03795 [Rickettsiales bacterium]|nr:hypothetical protein [Rickettsiales bacterium]
MRIITNNSEAKLVDFANSSRHSQSDNYAVHFRLSKLTETYKNDFHIKIAVNILNDIFREEIGEIVRMSNLDVFLLYRGADKLLLNKAIFQLRYLFFDDPLSNLPDGRENKEFCETYDLNFQWQQFSSLASKIMSEAMLKELGKDTLTLSEENSIKQPAVKLFPDIEKEIAETKLDSAIRKQPVCTIKDLINPIPKPLYNEIYINIPFLQRMLDTNFKLTSNKWLFNFLTEKLDEKVLEIVSTNPESFLYMPISLNLNLSSVLSKDFAEFSEIAKDFKSQLVIEITASDVLSDIYSFQKVKDLSQKRNHKICLDGLNNESFLHINRKKLGFDLVKLQWNADVKGDLFSKKENQPVRDAIADAGANRLILCRCDDIHAIEYGHALGISLFQGRYPDRLLNPQSMVIN